MDYHTELLNILKKLLHAKQRQPGTLVRITQQTLVMICQLSKDCFLKEESLIPLAPPIIVVGSIYGQFYNLLQIFEQNGHPPDKQYLFLGNYIDIGNQSIETITVLLVYKILYPEHVFLLRGNHESTEVNSKEGFKSECIGRYSSRLWNLFNDVFSYMPIAALIGSKILAVNSGISPQIDSIDFFKTVQRPIPKISGSGPIEDLFWSEPDPCINEYQAHPNGHSFVFGSTQVHEFLDRNHIEVLVRANEKVPNGFEFPFEPDRCMITLFSSPGYEDQSKIVGSVMTIDTDFSCNFRTLKPLQRRCPLPRTMNNYSSSYG